jgi:dihydroorotase
VKYAAEELTASGKHLLPGAIDDQVHFREPGLTYKANIYSESKAAVAGGVTSFMKCPTLCLRHLHRICWRKNIQSQKKTSLANYSFYMGTSNENFDEVLKNKQEEK